MDFVFLAQGAAGNRTPDAGGPPALPEEGKW